MTEHTCTTKERDDALYASLLSEPISASATEMVTDLADELWHDNVEHIALRSGLPFRRTVGALLGDLLLSAHPDPLRYTHRALRPELFTGQRIGYTTYRSVYDSLIACGYIEIGYRGQQQLGYFGQDGAPSERGGKLWSKATRFRATPLLLDRVRDGGIALDQWTDHFRLLPPPKIVPHPILRRASKLRGPMRYKGTSMPIDYVNDMAAIRLHDQVQRINVFLAKQAIVPDDKYRGLQRIFNEGDTPEFDWNKGGGLFAVGGGYQNLNKDERRAVTINGEAVAEIDLGASQLTILSALHGVVFDPQADPYTLPEGLPRSVVKKWVTVTLGHNGFHRAWPRTIKADFSKKGEGDLQQAYPIRETREAILRALPVLSDWADDPITCYDLQFVVT